MKKVLIVIGIVIVVAVVILGITSSAVDISTRATPDGSYIMEEDGNFFLYLFGKRTIQTERPCSAEVVNLDPSHSLGGLFQLYFIRLTDRDAVILYLNKEAVIELPVYFQNGSTICP